MKKSLLFLLLSSLVLASCDIKDLTSSNDETEETDEKETGGGHSGTGGGTGTGTGGGSGTGTGGGSGTGTGGGSGTGTGGGTETGGGGSGTGGGTEVGTTETVSKDLSNFELSNGEKPTTINFNEDLTLTCDVGTNRNKNKPGYYESDSSLRFYPGNTLKITSSKGAITRIVLGISNEGNGFEADKGTMSDTQTWTGSANEITFTADGTSGNTKLYRLNITYNTVGTGTTGGGTGTGGETGGGGTGGDTGGGSSTQDGNGNTSSVYTRAWSESNGEYAVAYNLFRGNLPCLKGFNGYKVGCVDGTATVFFNPYHKGFSKDDQTNYDNALRDMGYKLTAKENYVDEYGEEDPDTQVYYYEKGSYEVQTMHYRVDSDWYFDVYAHNNYTAPFKLDYEPVVDLTTKQYKIGSGYKSFTQTIKGITFACSNCTEDNSLIQLAKNSKMEITSTSALSKMDVTFDYNHAACTVYAGTSSSNAKPIYNDGSHFELPSGTKYVKIQAFGDDHCAKNANVRIYDIAIK